MLISLCTISRYKSMTVAVKVIKQDVGEHKVAQIKTQFLREVAMLSTLQHENVVKVISLL